MRTNLTRTECISLRGIAILAIVLHNYCHKLPHAPQENEFVFSIDNNTLFFSSLQWDQLFLQLCSFFGHLGVPVFVFLSGYGLAIKYDTIAHVDWKSFLWNHYKKLFIPLFIGSLVYAAIMLCLGHTYSHPHFLAQISMILNFFPNHQDRVFLPGPYWYFGMTCQLYIIYMLCVYKRSTKIVGFLCLCILGLQFLLYNHFFILNWVKFNSIGWFVPFTIGVVLARHPLNLTNKEYLCGTLALLPLIPLFGFQFHLWLLIPIAVTCLAICFIRIAPDFISRPLYLLGNISLYVFVIHPLVRELTVPLAHTWGSYIGLTIYVEASILLSWMTKAVVKMLKPAGKHA